MGFRPSKYRLAEWWLNLHDIEGGYEDLREIDEWLRTSVKIYPNALQRKWPYTKQYFSPMTHPHWVELTRMVDKFPDVLTRHRRYIQDSIYKERLLISIPIHL